MNKTNVVFVILFVGFVNCMQAQTAILEYKFNETGTNAPSTGSDTSTLTLFNSAGAATDLHTTGSGGVSGLSGDEAFDNTASVGMGGSPGGQAQSLASISAINGLTNFTLTGWFKTESTFQINNAILFKNFDFGGNQGFLLRGNGGQLNLSVDNFTASSNNSYTNTQAWVFFAVTYDGTISVNNVKFYVGNTVSSSIVSTNSINASAVNDTSGQTLALGLDPGAGNSAFDGYLDNFRVYNSVLDSGTIENIRSLDVSPIPEPHSVLLFIFGITILFSYKIKKSQA